MKCGRKGIYYVNINVETARQEPQLYVFKYYNVNTEQYRMVSMRGAFCLLHVVCCGSDVVCCVLYVARHSPRQH